MNYKNELEKIAQAKWRKYLDSKNNEASLYDAVADMTRNSDSHPVHNPGNINARKEIGMDKAELKRRLSSDVFNKSEYLPQYEKAYKGKISELTPEELKLRKYKMEDNQMEKFLNKKRIKGNNNTPMNIQTALKDPEEYVDIIHGTNRAKAEAFLRGGNGPTKLESMANLGNGKGNNMGIQVHSLVKDRAEGYANSQANSRGGSPAVLSGKIKRKYLYPNANHAQGNVSLSDEYGIPQELFNKIKDAKVYNPKSGEVYMEMSGNPNALPYGRTKTPGSLGPISRTKPVTPTEKVKEILSETPVPNKAKLNKAPISGQLRTKPVTPTEKVQEMLSGAPVPNKAKLNKAPISGQLRTKPVTPTEKVQEMLSGAPKINKAPISGNLTTKTTPTKSFAEQVVENINNNQNAKKGLSRNAKIGLGLGTGALALGAGAYGLKKIYDKKKQEKTAMEV